MQIPGMSGEPEVELLFGQLSYKCAGIHVYIYIRIHIHVHVSQRVQDSVPVASHILCSESLYIHGTKLLTALDIISQKQHLCSL